MHPRMSSITPEQCSMMSSCATIERKSVIQRFLLCWRWDDLLHPTRVWWSWRIPRAIYTWRQMDSIMYVAHKRIKLKCFGRYQWQREECSVTKGSWTYLGYRTCCCKISAVGPNIVLFRD
jgi:hypothetical protein